MVNRILFSNEAVAMRAKFISFHRAVRRVFGTVVCAGAGLLMAASAPAQNLFVADAGGGNVYEYTPDGTRTTFASGFIYPTGLTFNSAGNLFVGNENNNIYGADLGNNVTEITPAGTQSIFAYPVYEPRGLAFDSAGNLFAVDDQLDQRLHQHPTLHFYRPNGNDVTVSLLSRNAWFMNTVCLRVCHHKTKFQPAFPRI
jgi:sugar lactone lactonase YvrE